MERRHGACEAVPEREGDRFLAAPPPCECADVAAGDAPRRKGGGCFEGCKLRVEWVVRGANEDKADMDDDEGSGGGGSARRSPARLVAAPTS